MITKDFEIRARLLSYVDRHWSLSLVPLGAIRDALVDRGGATAVTVGLSLFAMLGLAALGSEGALWYTVKRTMQGGADSSAYAAALASATGGNYTTEAVAIAAQHGFVNGTNNVAVAVHRPPVSGNFVGNASAIQVIITQPQQRLLTASYLSANPVIAAGAVALPGTGQNCILALNRTASGAINAAGSINVSVSDCGIADDSNSNSALSESGGAAVTVDSATVVGGISQSNNSSLTTTVTPAPVTDGPVVADPYQNVQIPAYSGCDYNNLNPVHGTQTLDANGGVKVICGGIRVNAGASLTLKNGTFIVDSGSIDIAGGATFDLTNATVVLTSKTGNYGTITINGGATVQATAPTSGAMSGIAFFQDRNAPSSGVDKFNGGSAQNITGAIYTPSQSIQYAGGATAACTQVIGDQVSFTGNSTVKGQCSTAGTRQIASLPQLVE